MSNKKIIQKIVFGGIVEKGGKILILQRHKDEKIFPEMWELPSGKKEFLEPSEISLIREIKEETGLNVELIMPVSVFDYQIELDDEIKDSIQINFLTKLKKDMPVKISSEHMDYAWISKNELANYSLTNETRKAIIKSFDLIKNIKEKI